MRRTDEQVGPLQSMRSLPREPVHEQAVLLGFARGDEDCVVRRGLRYAQDDVVPRGGFHEVGERATSQDRVTVDEQDLPAEALPTQVIARQGRVGAKTRI